MKHIKKKCLGLSIIALLFTFLGTAVSAKSADLSAKAFEKMADEYMYKVLNEYHIAGAAVSVVKDGRVFFHKGYGYADIEKKKPVDPDTTIFQIASVSKLFTVTAAMQMVEQGKLSLDENVNRYLETFQLKNSFSKPVTLRNLLTHTSGLDDGIPLYLKSKGDLFFNTLPPLEKELRENLPSVVREPGSLCEYNPMGMALAGYLTQKVSGEAIGEYITGHILKPLGMNHSYYGLTKTAMTNMAKPYKYKNGKYTESAYTLSSDHPSADICASASDMAAFMLMHLNNGELNGVRVLNADTAKEMHRHQYPEDERLTGFGLGFYETIRNGRRTIEHGGYLPSFSSKMTLLPEENIGMFIAINTDSRKSSLVCNEMVDLFYDFFTDGVVDKNAEAAVKADVPFDLNLKKINGKYVFDTYGRTNKTKLKSVLITCDIRCDSQGNFRLNRPDMGIDWHFKYIGEGLFYSQDGGNYCKISKKNGNMVFSFIGYDFEKTPVIYIIMFIAAAACLPFFLISAIYLVVSAVRKRRCLNRGIIVVRGLLLLTCILVFAYFILNGIIGIESTNCDTFAVRNYLMPAMTLTCYLTAAVTFASFICIVRSQVKHICRLRANVYYFILVISAMVNLAFMYIMNGFTI